MNGPRPRLVIHGAGRMGRQVFEALEGSDFELLALISRRSPDWYSGQSWYDSLDAIRHRPDVLIDFSLPDGAVNAAAWCAGKGVALVSGTTGLNEDQDAMLKTASETVPVLHAANFSVGVNAVMTLLGLAGDMLDGPVEILDVHHVHKKDAPSGTAIAMADATGADDVRFDSRREGEIIGEHRVRFQLQGEVVEIRHEAHDRGIYARGALSAAAWLVSQSAGWWTASDWLASRSS